MNNEKLVFIPSLIRRKQILLSICKAKFKWRLSIIVSLILKLIAALIIIATIIFMNYKGIEFEKAIIFIVASVCFSLIPFFISLSVKNSANYKNGLPFSGYANGHLILDDNSLVYEFWQVGPREPAAYSSKRAVYNEVDKSLYVIEKQSIKNISINDLGVCKITGDGKLLTPNYNSKRNMYNEKKTKSFEFICSFDTEFSENIANDWRINYE